MEIDSRIVVFADDSTGALEVAAGFAPLGAAVDLTPAPGWMPAKTPRVQVLMMESRMLSGDQAAKRLAPAARSAWQEGVWGIYHKSDSTLRGNIGAELSAIVKVTGQPLVYSPANPRLGRICRDGKLRIDGVALHRTDFARDPLFPALTDDVVDALRPQMSVPARIVTPADTRSLFSGKIVHEEILIPDIENERELEIVARHLLAEDRWIAAGSGGLAKAMGTLLGCGGRNDCMAAAPLPVPALIVCGSVHPHSRALAGQAEAAGVPLLPLDAGTDETCRAWTDACARRGIGLLRTAGPGGPVSRGAAACQSAALARVTAVICRARAPVSLVIFGGDTASAVLHGLGIRTLTSLGEIAPGFALSSTALNGRNLWVATRPGGFSADDDHGGWMRIFGQPDA